MKIAVGNPLPPQRPAGMTARLRPCLLIAAALLAASCDDPKIGPQASDSVGPAPNAVQPTTPSPVQAENSTLSSPATAGPSLPLKRNLIDSQGRALKVEILAKRNGFVALRRLSDSGVFSIDITTLSRDDQLFLATIDESSAETVAQVKQVVAPERPRINEAAASVNPMRKARWNTNFGTAMDESASTGYPVYFLFTGSTWCPPCKALEGGILDTDEFQDFANGNLVLMKVDVPSGGAKGNDKKLVSEYGVDGYPTVLLLGDQKKEWIRKSGFSNKPVSAYIEDLQVVIERQK